MTGLDMASGAMDVLDQAHRGNMLAFGTSQLLRGYAVNQEFLFAAIDDWDLGDEVIQGMQGDVSRIVRNAYGTISQGNGSILDQGTPWWVPLLAGASPQSGQASVAAAGENDVFRSFYGAGSKRHGSNTHYAAMYMQTLELIQRFEIDPASITINRTLRGRNGETISKMRPDVQMRTMSGDLVVVEVGLSQSAISLESKGKKYRSVVQNFHYDSYKMEGLQYRKRPGRIRR